MLPATWAWMVLIISCTGAFGFSRELIQTNIVYRHGDRAPTEVYPNDDHPVSTWPDGLGMLTQRGKEQQTRLGAFLRQRYPGFISDKFINTELYVRSSDFDRTLESAYSNLAGLFAANHSDMWEGRFVKWQPVPVHSVPTTLDQVLNMGRPCAKYDSLYNETILPALERLDKDYSEMFTLLSKFTGYEDMGYSKAWRVRDTLFCERAHNLTWPEWASWSNISCAPSAAIPCKDREVYDILYDFSVFQYNLVAKERGLHKFHGGPLLMDILNNFNKIAEDRSNTPQFYMYSAHDTTVAAILSVMGAFDHILPEYTATVFVELWNTSGSEKKSWEYVVELYHKNVTDDDRVWPLNISGCPAPCTLTYFTKLYRNLTIASWDKACYNFGGITEEEIITISICLAVVVGLSLAAVICHSRRQRVSQGYTKVRTEAAESLPLTAM